MDVRIRPLLWPAFALVLLASCSDDPLTGGDTRDTSPPEIATITPLDLYHVEVTFSEAVTKETAEDIAHYQVTQAGIPAAAAPGDPLYVVAAVLSSDPKRVSLSTYHSMSDLALTLAVSGVSDASGNAASSVQDFAGSNLPDQAPPEIDRITPAAGVTDAPVGVNVNIRFSEYVDDDAMRPAHVTWTTPEGPVPFYVDSYTEPGFTLVPQGLLEYNTVHTITLTDVRDRSGNRMDASWSFTTTGEVDRTPPRLVASYPAHLARDVDVDTPITLTFSEPVDRYDFRFDTTPEIILDNQTWSDEGKSVSYTMREWDPLSEGRQYMLTIYPGGVHDLGGNTIAAVQKVLFTTGSTLERGSISGRVMGDPGTEAADPTGAIVFAEFYDLYNLTTVEQDNTYTLSNLRDYPYFVDGYLDTNHDGYYYPIAGDAFGGYGADPSAGDWDVAAVGIYRARHLTEVDFSLHDPSAIIAEIGYEGDLEPWRPIRVGLFATSNDAVALENPVAVTECTWPYDPVFVFNSIWQEIDEGDYYMAGYIDADSSGAFEPDIDPMGVYGGPIWPYVVHMRGGKDLLGILMAVFDPPGSPATHRVVWPAPAHNVAFERMNERAMKRSPSAEPDQPQVRAIARRMLAGRPTTG